MSTSDLITEGRELAGKLYEEGSDACVAQFIFKISSALEANERKIAEQAHEINTMKLVIKKMEARRR